LPRVRARLLLEVRPVGRGAGAEERKERRRGREGPHRDGHDGQACRESAVRHRDDVRRAFPGRSRHRPRVRGRTPPPRGRSDSPSERLTGIHMKRVTGIGGVFFKAKDPAALQAWYKNHLGIDVQPWGGAAFDWTDADGKPTGGTTAWTITSEKSNQFAPSTASFMI